MTKIRHTIYRFTHNSNNTNLVISPNTQSTLRRLYPEYNDFRAQLFHSFVRITAFGNNNITYYFNIKINHTRIY